MGRHYCPAALSVLRVEVGLCFSFKCRYNRYMRITAEIALQMAFHPPTANHVILSQRAYDELLEENPPQLNTQTTPPTIFGLIVRVSKDPRREVTVMGGL